jgi:hypothetical protein
MHAITTCNRQHTTHQDRATLPAHSLPHWCLWCAGQRSAGCPTPRLPLLLGRRQRPRPLQRMLLAVGMPVSRNGGNSKQKKKRGEATEALNPASRSALPLPPHSHLDCLCSSPQCTPTLNTVHNPTCTSPLPPHSYLHHCAAVRDVHNNQHARPTHPTADQRHGQQHAHVPDVLTSMAQQWPLPTSSGSSRLCCCGSESSSSSIITTSRCPNTMSTTAKNPTNASQGTQASNTLTAPQVPVVAWLELGWRALSWCQAAAFASNSARAADSAADAAGCEDACQQ